MEKIISIRKRGSRKIPRFFYKAKYIVNIDRNIVILTFDTFGRKRELSMSPKK